MKQTQQHPLFQYAKALKEEGILVFDDVRGLPVYNEPFVSPDFIVSLNLSGWVLMDYDTNPVEFCPHDISVVMPDHMLNARYSSDDYHAMQIVLSGEHFEQIKQDYPLAYQKNIHYHWHAHFHLEDQQFQTVKSLFQTISGVCRTKPIRRHSIADNLLKVLFMLMQEYREANGMTVNPHSKAEQLFARFRDALSEHYTESREVQYYADLFSLSPKYFATVIRQQTGTKASEWIWKFVIMQAKSQLLYHPELTVQQIALRLGFPDQMAFARYFKTYVGLTPKEFRLRKPK